MNKNLDSEKYFQNTIKTPAETKELSSLERILITAIRRKRIFLITLISFLVFGFIRTTKELIFNSTYQGNFTLLIQDPIVGTKPVISDDSALAGAFFNLDSSSTAQDVPTLRKLLLSELILKDIAKDFKLTPKVLSDRIKIKEDYTSKGF